MINEFNENGYLILNNVFDQNTINSCKEEILHYINNINNNNNKSCEGISIPDFINKKGFENTINLKNNKKIHELLKIIFSGTDYRFCSHNDIGVNRIVGWHKDKLNNQYSKYQTINIWNKYNQEKHEIVKVLIYLEDHSNDNYGLKIIPKSHLNPNIKIENTKQLKPKLGDVIIFDQRITHRGMEKNMDGTRILISFGFGKNNIFTDEFEKGTIQRQNDQNNL